jgi:Protein tyrosine and serine/threonine kinase
MTLATTITSVVGAVVWMAMLTLVIIVYIYRPRWTQKYSGADASGRVLTTVRVMSVVVSLLSAAIFSLFAMSLSISFDLYLTVGSACTAIAGCGVCIKLLLNLLHVRDMLRWFVALAFAGISLLVSTLMLLVAQLSWLVYVWMNCSESVDVSVGQLCFSYLLSDTLGQFNRGGLIAAMVYTSLAILCSLYALVLLSIRVTRHRFLTPWARLVRHQRVVLVLAVIAFGTMLVRFSLTGFLLNTGYLGGGLVLIAGVTSGPGTVGPLLMSTLERTQRVVPMLTGLFIVSVIAIIIFVGSFVASAVFGPFLPSLGFGWALASVVYLSMFLNLMIVIFLMAWRRPAGGRGGWSERLSLLQPEQWLRSVFGDANEGDHDIKHLVFADIAEDKDIVKVSPEHIDVLEEIGSGGFGAVFRGIWAHSSKAQKRARDARRQGASNTTTVEIALVDNDNDDGDDIVDERTRLLDSKCDGDGAEKSAPATPMFEEGAEGTRVIAIKKQHISSSDPELMRDFYVEIKFLSKLQHKHIVEFIGIVLSEATSVWLLTEFCSGGSLRDAMDKGDVPEPMALKWSMEISLAMSFLHAHNPAILHRDLKVCFSLRPGNRSNEAQSNLA